MQHSFARQIQDACFLHLNSEQLAAMEHSEGPALVLAVPGSGKTTLMLARTLSLIETHHVPARQILTMTFSKAAALDLNHRYNQTFRQAFQHQLNFSTIHRYCYALLRKYQTSEKPLTLIEGNAHLESKRQLLAELYREETHEFISEDRLEELSNSISYIKNMMLHTDQFKKHGYSQNYLEPIYRRYEAVKRKHQWIDFDDMLSYALQLLQTNKHILQQEQRRYQYIQVDESQDISKIQYEIIKHLAYPKNNLYMVADDDQSIYGFRGACPKIILDFESVYPNAVKYTLNKNYRSTEKIIQICNQLIQNNQDRHYKTIEPVVSQNPSDIHPVKVITTETVEEQNDYLIDHLNRKSYGETAILFRNNLSAIPVIERFERDGIPYYIRDFNFYFFNHWIVKDIRSFFELAIIPSDIEVLERIYYKMNAYISKRAVQSLYTHGAGASVFERLCQFPEHKPYQIERIQKLQAVFVKIAEASPLRAIEIIEKDLGYRQYLEDQVQNKGSSKEQIRYYFSHLKYIASEAKSLLSFEERLEHLKKSIYESRHNHNASAVTLSTMHGSKGLEFDTVFVIDTTDGIIPTRKAMAECDKGTNQLLEEERRLFYVSLSRARYRLHIMQTRFLNGEYTRPSPFLSELIENNENAVAQQTIKANTNGHSELHVAFDIGDRLNHARFGPGELIGVDGDTLSIAFDDGEIRDLSYRICSENNLLALA